MRNPMNKKLVFSLVAMFVIALGIFISVRSSIPAGIQYDELAKKLDARNQWGSVVKAGLREVQNE
jgi:hypothetical protein